MTSFKLCVFRNSPSARAVKVKWQIQRGPLPLPQAGYPLYCQIEIVDFSA